MRTEPYVFTARGQVVPDEALKLFGAEAREELVNKLLDGETVHGYNARDVFDAQIQHRRVDALELLEDLVALDRKGGDDYQLDSHDLVGRAKAVIEAFVDAHPDWIQERAEEIDAEHREDSETD